MTLRYALPLCLALASTSALAQGGHGHGNSAGHAHDLTVGEPGKADKVTRTVEVEMLEGDGTMSFTPASLTVKRGETIRFRIVNKGALDHEFVLDDHHRMMEHKALMEKFPEMEHDDPNAVRLEPGEDGEIVWAFTKDGTFEFGCLIPGHYEAGMKGGITVSRK